MSHQVNLEFLLLAIELWKYLEQENGLGRIGVGRCGFSRNHELRKGRLARLRKDYDNRLKWAPAESH
jgi:hypothetical protein